MAIDLRSSRLPDGFLLAAHRYGEGRHAAGQHALAGGAAIAIAGMIGAGLMFALVMDPVTEAPDPPIRTYPVPLPPPPTPDPDVQPVPDPPISRPTVVPPLVPAPPVYDPPVFQPSGGEITDPGPIIGSGEGPAGPPAVEQDPPAPPPVPVLQAAQRHPRYLGDFQPPYPPGLEREGVEGRARVNVTISAAGRVTAVRDAGSSHAEFFEATRRHALRNWRFLPATRDGQPEESTQTLTVQFLIDR